MHGIEVYGKVDTYYILIVPSKVQMLNCMPTLHRIIPNSQARCTEQVNIVNILCFTSTMKCFAVDGEYWFHGRRRVDRTSIEVWYKPSLASAVPRSYQ